MTITAADLVVPYITAREGEEADSLLNLNVRIGPDRRPRLGYKDEAGPDRDLRGVLWARYSMSLGFAGQPTGNPRWRLVHPLRQRITMALLRCQVCTVPLKRSDGILFVETADDGDDYTGPVKTAQPPVCLKHARMAARRCPRLRSKGHVALLATRFPPLRRHRHPVPVHRRRHPAPRRLGRSTALQPPPDRLVPRLSARTRTAGLRGRQPGRSCARRLDGRSTVLGKGPDRRAAPQSFLARPSDRDGQNLNPWRSPVATPRSSGAGKHHLSYTPTNHLELL